MAFSVNQLGPRRYSGDRSRRRGPRGGSSRRLRGPGDVHTGAGGSLRPGHQQQEQRGRPRGHLLPQGLPEGGALRQSKPHDLRDMRDTRGPLQEVRQDHRRQRRGRGQAAGGHHHARQGHRRPGPGAHRRRRGPRAGAQRQGRRRHTQPHHGHRGRPRPYGPLPQGGPW